MQTWLDNHRKVVQKLLRDFNPTAGWSARPVYVTHGRYGTGPMYQATLHHPSHILLEDALEGIGPGRENDLPTKGEGQWLTLHPEGTLGEGRPVYVAPNKHGHAIQHGVGGRLNGLLLSGIMDEDAYRELAANRRIRGQRARKYAEMAARIEANRLAQEAAAKGEVAPMQSQAHLLPLTAPQAVAYVRGKHNGVSSEAMNAILHSHPEGAKAEWLSQFADAHRGEPIMVVAQNSHLMGRLAARLQNEGHRVAHVNGPLDPLNRAHQDALLSFLPPRGPREADILIGPEIRREAMLPHHAVYLDTMPTMAPDPTIHLSSHILQTDPEGSLVHAGN